MKLIKITCQWIINEITGRKNTTKAGRRLHLLWQRLDIPVEAQGVAVPVDCVTECEALCGLVGLSRGRFQLKFCRLKKLNYSILVIRSVGSSE
jgi:hypothetical protein